MLRCLQNAGPLSLIALGKLLDCEAGSPSRLVNMLVEKALVERKENLADRRQVTLRLTATGERLATRLSKVEDELHHWIRDRLGAPGVAAAATYMRQLVDGTLAGNAIARRKASPEA